VWDVRIAPLPRLEARRRHGTATHAVPRVRGEGHANTKCDETLRRLRARPADVVVVVVSESDARRSGSAPSKKTNWPSPRRRTSASSEMGNSMLWPNEEVMDLWK